MSKVHDLGSGSLNPAFTLDPTTSTTPTSTTRANQTTATQPLGRVESDTAVRVRSSSSALTAPESALPPPSTPAATFTNDTARGAYSFSSQLMNVGNTPTSTETMLAQYLKLQIDGQGMYQVNEAMASYAQHSMLGTAIDGVKQSNLAKAETLRQQASSLATQGGAILDGAGVDKPLAEQCYRNGKATGRTDEQSLKTYLDTRKSQGADAETLAREEAALRQAAPIAQQADAAATQAGAIDANYMFGVGASAAIRAGTIGMDALLKNQEAQVQITNDIAAVLGGGRNADRKRSRESWLEIDSHRNEVAKLVLDITDKHQSANVGKAGTFRS
jgi:hypothetical protein